MDNEIINKLYRQNLNLYSLLEPMLHHYCSSDLYLLWVHHYEKYYSYQSHQYLKNNSALFYIVFERKHRHCNLLHMPKILFNISIQFN